jgi:hypothetical protein
VGSALNKERNRNTLAYPSTGSAPLIITSSSSSSTEVRRPQQGRWRRIGAGDAAGRRRLRNSRAGQKVIGDAELPVSGNWGPLLLLPLPALQLAPRLSSSSSLLCSALVVVLTLVSASAALSGRQLYCNNVRTKARRQGRNYLP